MPPTIAHVLHRLYLAGAEVLAAALARRLRDRYRFIFLCLDEIGPLGEQLAREGFTVIDLKRRPGVDLSVASRIGEITRAENIQLLHAHQYTPFFYAAVSRGLRRRPPILFTEHGRHYPDVRKRKRILANRLLLRRGDRVTAVGEFVKQALINNEGIAARRIEVVYNGIDPARFDVRDDDATRRAVRHELGLDQQQPAVLQVARFHSVKDHATGLRAFAAAVDALNESAEAGQASRPPVSGARPLTSEKNRLSVPPAESNRLSVPPILLLAGDGELKADAEALAAELGVADHVKFLGVRDDVPRLMAAADLFMLSSLSEGISVTLLEAMGAALPIAATDVGGNREVVAHQTTGLLSPRRDHAALAANLAALLADPDLRRRMGTAARQRLLETFTEHRMHRRYADIYDHMLPPR